jgi:hypothetical protein
VYRVEYPEKARRERMLWDVYEWFQQQTDYDPRLRYYEVETMGVCSDTRTAETGTEVDEAAAERQKAQQLNLFVRLVDEGYINAELKRELVGGPPVTSAVIRGLSERGLIEIGELPDPQEKIIQGLEANIRRIEQDTSMSPDRKQYLIAAGRQTLRRIDQPPVYYRCANYYGFKRRHSGLAHRRLLK